MFSNAIKSLDSNKVITLFFLFIGLIIQIIINPEGYNYLSLPIIAGIICYFKDIKKLEILGFLNFEKFELLFFKTSNLYIVIIKRLFNSTSFDEGVFLHEFLEVESRTDLLQGGIIFQHRGFFNFAKLVNGVREDLKDFDIDINHLNDLNSLIQKICGNLLKYLENQKYAKFKENDSYDEAITYLKELQKNGL